VEITTIVALTFIGGLVLGAGFALAIRRDHGAKHEPTRETIPPGADAVLSVLPSSVVLLDGAGSVLKATAPAYALGVMRGQELAVPEISRMVQQVARDGQVREDDLRVEAGSNLVHIHARVAPLTSRYVIVLIDERTQAERATELRRDFVANVSHELKTPAGAIAVLAEAIQAASHDPDAVAYFAARLNDESNRMTRLVEQIIDLSRLQHDVLDDDPVPVDVEQILADAAAAVHHAVEAKSISIETSCVPDLKVRGHPGQLESAVSNLLENAVAYSADGAVVRASATVTDENAHITVSDTGVGMSSDQTERIFERFYRVDPSRGRTTGGSGLGLSIVKHIAASHGGTVSAKSAPGAGSVFTITVPRLKNDTVDGSGPQL